MKQKRQRNKWESSWSEVLESYSIKWKIKNLKQKIYVSSTVQMRMPITIRYHNQRWGSWMRYLQENYKKEAQIKRQVQQVPNKFQVKGINSSIFPLTFHKHVTEIKHIFDKSWHSCSCQYHIPEKKLRNNWRYPDTSWLFMLLT